jgi:hypothetical protein
MFARGIDMRAGSSMPITMQGSWTITVKSKNASFPQRFVVSNAASGNGAHDGLPSAGPLAVTGASWTIDIQNNPGDGWRSSKARLKLPTVVGGSYRFDIESNDAGSDSDYDDLVLTCTTPITATDFIVYGTASQYSRGCLFNPCFPRWVVIDTPDHLREALKIPSLRDAIRELYPRRIPLPNPPDPRAQPEPFPPLVLPIADERPLPARQAMVLSVAQARRAPAGKAEATASTGPVLATRTLRRDLTEVAAVKYDRLAVAKYVDRFKLLCRSQPLAGYGLRFQEYDRTNAELAGGSYSGAGDRETLGACATDENGNYMFRFSRTISDFVQEGLDDVAATEDAVVQSMPDVIVQLLDASAPGGVAFESAPYWNVPLLKRIDICVPSSSVRDSTCLGGRVIERIGDISLLSSLNTLSDEGRITAKSTIGSAPQTRCAAWTGDLALSGCFGNMAVKYYTVRYRQKVPGADWHFHQVEERRLQGAKIGLPGYDGDKIGPFFPSLFVPADGNVSAVAAPAYLSTELNDANNPNIWITSDRTLKAVLHTRDWKLPPGPFEVRIDGYRADGTFVQSVTDTVTLFVDNDDPVAGIASVKLGAHDVVIDDSGCTLLTLAEAELGAELSVEYRVRQDQGFVGSYRLYASRCNEGGAYPTSDAATGDASAGNYVHDDAESCDDNLFRGTPEQITADVDGFVTAKLIPASPWLAGAESFTIIKVLLAFSKRVTNGKNTGEVAYGPRQIVFGIQK